MEVVIPFDVAGWVKLHDKNQEQAKKLGTG